MSKLSMNMRSGAVWFSSDRTMTKVCNYLYWQRKHWCSYIRDVLHQTVRKFLTPLHRCKSVRCPYHQPPAQKSTSYSNTTVYCKHANCLLFAQKINFYPII